MNFSVVEINFVFLVFVILVDFQLSIRAYKTESLREYMSFSKQRLANRLVLTMRRSDITVTHYSGQKYVVLTISKGDEFR